MMARALSVLFFAIGLLYLLSNALSLITGDSSNLAVSGVCACAWLIAGIAGVLVAGERAQYRQSQVESEERKRQHLELMAALKKTNEKLTIIAILAEGQKGGG